MNVQGRERHGDHGHGHLARGFRSWAFVRFERDRKRRLAYRGAARLLHHGLSLGWSTWVAMRTEREHKHRLVYRGAARLVHRGLALGWMSWRYALQIRRHALFLLNRSSRFLLHRQLALAFAMWRYPPLKGTSSFLASSTSWSPVPESPAPPPPQATPSAQSPPPVLPPSVGDVRSAMEQAVEQALKREREERAAEDHRLRAEMSAMRRELEEQSLLQAQRDAARLEAAERAEAAKRAGVERARAKTPPPRPRQPPPESQRRPSEYAHAAAQQAVDAAKQAAAEAVAAGLATSLRALNPNRSFIHRAEIRIRGSSRAQRSLCSLWTDPRPPRQERARSPWRAIR